jgi:hypothetical protein
MHYHLNLILDLSKIARVYLITNVREKSHQKRTNFRIS